MTAAARLFFFLLVSASAHAADWEAFFDPFLGDLRSELAEARVLAVVSRPPGFLHRVEGLGPGALLTNASELAAQELEVELVAVVSNHEDARLDCTSDMRRYQVPGRLVR